MVEGKIFKKGKHSDNYKAFFIPPDQINTSELCVSTENLTSATNANRTNACDKLGRSKYFMPFTVETDWKVSKIKALVSLIIHLATVIVSFQHFRIFSKRLIFIGLKEVFVKK